MNTFDLFFVRGRLIQVKREDTETLLGWKERVAFFLKGARIFPDYSVEYLYRLARFHSKKVTLGVTFPRKVERQVREILDAI